MFCYHLIFLFYKCPSLAKGFVPLANVCWLLGTPAIYTIRYTGVFLNGFGQPVTRNNTVVTGLGEHSHNPQLI